MKPSPDVLIVGAGPTGLALGCELLRHGVGCRVVDELAEPVVWSKAAVVQTRTMEVFDAMGVSAALLDRAKALHGSSFYAEGKRVGHAVFEGVASRFPYPYGVSQHDTEAVLAERFAELGGAVERSRRLEAFTQRADGVAARVAGPAGQESIETKWIVGCDGAHSAVRKLCDFTFEGSDYEEHLIQADVRVDWPARADDDDEIQIFLHPDGPLALFPLFKDGRYRLIAFLLPGHPDVEPTLPVFQRLLDARGPAGARASDPAWTVAFRIHHRRTNRYRDRRAFVAGDAAHIHSPAGGQGMNTGIQDAQNLAWKLALVQKGASPESLLDSYEAERLPVAKALLTATDAATRGLEAMTRLRRPISVGLRNQLLSFVTKLDVFREALGRSISMTGIHYADSPIVRQDRSSLLRANVGPASGGEEPSLVDWAAFGEGPAPGSRAVDAELPEQGRLFDRLRDPRHLMLLFDGAAATEETSRNLASLGRLVTERYGALVQVCLVVPRATQAPSQAWNGPLVLDVDGRLHKSYGARTECLYLLRPDGYVGYRSQPAHADRLMAYLKTIFRE